MRINYWFLTGKEKLVYNFTELQTLDIKGFLYASKNIF